MRDDYKPQGQPGYEYGSTWFLKDNLPIENVMIGWSYWVMLRERGISLTILGEQMGVGRERARQILEEAVYSPNEKARYRIDRAITEITANMHRSEGHIDEDPICAVFSTLNQLGTPRVREAHAKGEREYWDEYFGR